MTARRSLPSSLSLVSFVAFTMLGCMGSGPTKCPETGATAVTTVATTKAVMSTRAPSEPVWSKAMQGVRGRIIATPTHDAAGRPQLELDLVLENVSDLAAPIEIAWGSFGGMLKLTLEDEAGKVVPPHGVGGNEMTIPTRWLQLPLSSALRMNVSRAAYEYVSATRTMLRPVSWQAWDLPSPRTSKLYLRVELKPMWDPPAPADHHAWAGPLWFPRVELP